MATTQQVRPQKQTGWIALPLPNLKVLLPALSSFAYYPPLFLSSSSSVTPRGNLMPSSLIASIPGGAKPIGTPIPKLMNCAMFSVPKLAASAAIVPTPPASVSSAESGLQQIGRLLQENLVPHLLLRCQEKLANSGVSRTRLLPFLNSA